jgi:hypothetical protein
VIRSVVRRLRLRARFLEAEIREILCSLFALIEVLRVTFVGAPRESRFGLNCDVISQRLALLDEIVGS